MDPRTSGFSTILQIIPFFGDDDFPALVLYGLDRIRKAGGKRKRIDGPDSKTYSFSKQISYSARNLSKLWNSSDKRRAVPDVEDDRLPLWRENSLRK
jgi:hypothetical protein